VLVGVRGAHGAHGGAKKEKMHPKREIKRREREKAVKEWWKMDRDLVGC